MANGHTITTENARRRETSAQENTPAYLTGGLFRPSTSSLFPRAVEESLREFSWGTLQIRRKPRLGASHERSFGWGICWKLISTKSQNNQKDLKHLYQNEVSLQL